MKSQEKYFKPSEEHIEKATWPTCSCMDCASNEDDRLTQESEKQFEEILYRWDLQECHKVQSQNKKKIDQE